MAEILIVEDELSINELIRRNLSLTGHHCTGLMITPPPIPHTAPTTLAPSATRKNNSIPIYLIFSIPRAFFSRGRA